MGIWIFCIGGFIGSFILIFSVNKELGLKLAAEKQYLVIAVGTLLGLVFNIRIDSPVFPYVIWQGGVMAAIAFAILWHDQKNEPFSFVRVPLWLILVAAVGGAAALYTLYVPVQKYIAHQRELSGSDISVCDMKLHGHAITGQGTDSVYLDEKWLVTTNIASSSYHSTSGGPSFTWKESQQEPVLFSANCERIPLQNLQRDDRITVYTGPQNENGVTQTLAIKKEGGVAPEFGQLSRYNVSSPYFPVDRSHVVQQITVLCGTQTYGLRAANQEIVSVKAGVIETRDLGDLSGPAPKVFDEKCSKISAADLHAGDRVEVYTLSTGAADLIKKVATTDLSTWKTFTNSKYGYSFKYPAEAGPVVDGLPNHISVPLPLATTGVDFRKYFQVDVEPARNELCYFEYEKFGPQDQITPEVALFTAGGNTFKHFDDYSRDKAHPSMTSTYAVRRGDFCYTTEMRLFGKANVFEERKLVEQILETLTFDALYESHPVSISKESVDDSAPINTSNTDWLSDKPRQSLCGQNFRSEIPVSYQVDKIDSSKKILWLKIGNGLDGRDYTKARLFDKDCKEKSFEAISIGATINLYFPYDIPNTTMLIQELKK